MKKKAQAEIIVTILIILLVLAAIVIVWQVISNTINQGAKEIPGQTDCLMTKVDIISATEGFCTGAQEIDPSSPPAAPTNRVMATQPQSKTDCTTVAAPVSVVGVWHPGTLVLKRSVGTGKLTGVIVLIDNIRNSTLDFTKLGALNELDQRSYEYDTLVGGKPIKIAKLIGTDIETARLCEPSDNSAADPILIKTM